MNCLQYALEFWDKNPDYRLWYNSDHVINLPSGSYAIGFYPAEDFGFTYFFNWHGQGLIDTNAVRLLVKYFNSKK
jgi:hypothetical protein